MDLVVVMLEVVVKIVLIKKMTLPKSAGLRLSYVWLRPSFLTPCVLFPHIYVNEYRPLNYGSDIYCVNGADPILGFDSSCLT